MVGVGWARDLLCSLEDLKAKMRGWSFKTYGVIQKKKLNESSNKLSI